MSMPWTLETHHVPHLARGAAVLGTGGGGDPHIGALLATQALASHGPVEVVALDEVPADARVVMVAMMGAPTVMVEKLPSIDLLLTDIVMPGMSGLALAERLRSIRPGLRVLFISGFSGRAQEELQGRATPDILPKPFTPSALARRVRDVITPATS